MENTLQNFARQLDGRKEAFHDERFDDEKCLVISHIYYLDVKNEEDRLMDSLRWIIVESKK